MKAYRVYYIDPRTGEKIYNCESPGYWSHHCASPENCVVFLDKEKALQYAEIQKKHVAPSGVDLHVEEYDETRPLMRHKYDDIIRPADIMPYLTDSCCYEPVPNPPMKKYSDWHGSLSEYLQVGNLVDEEMVKYFINVLPPVTMNGSIIQMGEPYNHVNGKPIYHTLHRTPEGWHYDGCCHRGKTQDLLNLWQVIRCTTNNGERIGIIQEMAFDHESPVLTTVYTEAAATEKSKELSAQLGIPVFNNDVDVWLE